MYFDHLPPARRRRPVIHGELVGSNICTAVGITARANAPVLALCRQLIAAGLDPDSAMEVYRGTTLALRVRTIGAAARLEINGDGTGFRPVREPDAGPLARQTGAALPPARESAP